MAAANAAKPVTGGRIDVHTHLMAPALDPEEWEMEECLRLAKRAGVSRHVLLGNLYLGGKDWVHAEPDGIRAVNTHTLKAMARHPDRFIGFCYLNPANPVDFTQDEITRCVVDGGMKGLKFEAAVKATDRRYDPICERAEKLGITIMHHTWYNVLGCVWPTESTPAEAADLARRFPNVSFIFAHLGGGRERGVHDLVDLPNVCYDTSGSYAETELVEYAAKQLGAERLIFGSDYPGRNIGVQAGRVLGARLSPREHELILGGNLARVLKLEGAAA
ncbi:MAG: amidohydrolase [Planctomycetes bacterium]|nr:amidohydrolase [Planctomycetota bacterium]